MRLILKVDAECCLKDLPQVEESILNTFEYIDKRVDNGVYLCILSEDSDHHELVVKFADNESICLEDHVLERFVKQEKYIVGYYILGD